MSRQQRFSFDDDEFEIKKTDDKIKEPVIKKPKSKPVVDNGDTKEFTKDDLVIPKKSEAGATFVFDKDTVKEDEAINDGDQPMKNKSNKNKKKFRPKKWLVALMVIVAAAAAFLIYVFVATGNNGPVYGDRCASLLAVDTAKFEEVKNTMAADGNIASMNIEMDCRIIKISINFIDNTPSAQAETIATNTLHALDDSLSAEKAPNSTYSSYFNTANGRGQYNVEFVLTSNGDTNFPIFGTKHPSSDAISFTGSNPVNQATTDKVVAGAATDETQQ